MEDKNIPIITTISGLKEPISNCRKIKNEYYKIGDINILNSGDCYFIDGKYRRENTGYIIYDYAVSQYVLKNQVELITEKGIVDFKDEQPIFGAFSGDIKNIKNYISVIIDDKSYICMNENLLQNNIYYSEDLTSGRYYKRQSLPSRRFIEPAPCDQGFKQSLEYDSRNIISKYSKIYDELYQPNYTKTVDKWSNILVKDLTFGLEFETVNGFIPDRIGKKLGLIPLRDGSINGLEYVTIPLSGKKGVQTILDSLKELKKRTRFDRDCSLHLHIGNIPRTEEFFVALYKVLFIIQDQFFELFPLYKKYNFGVKKKHYTKPFSSNEVFCKLDPIIDNKKSLIANFNHLYQFLSMGQDYSEVDNNMKNIKSHPSDPQGNAKWQIKSRYYWVNLIPLLFGNKQTIEFRMHTPTYDANKVIGFLGLCCAIINFVKQNEKNILTVPNFLGNINLHNILDNVMKDSILDFMYDYISQRKQYIYYNNCKGDIIADENNFVFKSHIDWRIDKPEYLELGTFKKIKSMYQDFNNNIQNIAFNQDLHIQNVADGIQQILNNQVIDNDPVPVPVEDWQQNEEEIEMDEFDEQDNNNF